MRYDKIIIGAGLYGLYAALSCARRDERVLVLECEKEAFLRATYINQARVHMGYHYPRSFSTAIKSAGYFERFNEDYGFCINQEFDKIYATSAKFSWTDGEQFKKFSNAAGIPCEELVPEQFFREGMCDGAFLTREYTYDANILKEYFIKELSGFSNANICYGVSPTKIEVKEDEYEIEVSDGCCYITPYLLNASYASTNQILHMVGYEKLGIKYELCEIILCEVSDRLKDLGITVMDGPFFSIMPFGKTGLHSLTSVTFTPHETCYEELPKFDCQSGMGDYCNNKHLGNCNLCSHKPETAWSYMSGLAHKYLKDNLKFKYHSSLYSMKPILKSSEIDDSRPTVIRKFSENPTFVSVLSGKINTVYDLDEVLFDDKK